MTSYFSSLGAKCKIILDDYFKTPHQDTLEFMSLINKSISNQELKTRVIETWIYMTVAVLDNTYSEEEVYFMIDDVDDYDSTNCIEYQSKTKYNFIYKRTEENKDNIPVVHNLFELLAVCCCIKYGCNKDEVYNKSVFGQMNNIELDQLFLSPMKHFVDHMYTFYKSQNLSYRLMGKYIERLLTLEC